EFTDVMQRTNDAVTLLMKQLQGSQTGKLILQHIQGGSGFSPPGVLGNLFTVSVRFLVALVVTVIGGFYLAAQPGLYRSGLAKLFPRRLRKEANETLHDIGLALRLVADRRHDSDGTDRVAYYGGRVAYRIAIAAGAWGYRGISRIRPICG